jgi:hypothetical protein
MTTLRYRIVTGVEHPNLRTLSREIIPTAWPEFMLHDPVANGLNECYERLPQYQFALIDDNTGDAVAMANSIPLCWQGDIDDLPDDGWDWALTRGLGDLAAGRTPNLLCALQIVVPKRFKGMKISPEAVLAMKNNGRKHGLMEMVAPVRPSAKADYPLTSIDNYVRWTTAEHLPFDPWMRVHARLGARLVKPCHHAMRITGTIAEWENWTGLRFPESGPYIVPGALVPVEIDIAANLGTYIEPNVWMHHR